MSGEKRNVVFPAQRYITQKTRSFDLVSSSFKTRNSVLYRFRKDTDPSMFSTHLHISANPFIKVIIRNNEPDGIENATHNTFARLDIYHVQRGRKGH
jgi:hypothetical protein